MRKRRWLRGPSSCRCAVRGRTCAQQADERDKGECVEHVERTRDERPRVEVRGDEHSDDADADHELDAGDESAADEDEDQESAPKHDDDLPKVPLPLIPAANHRE